MASISDESSVADVQTWLRSQGFSQTVRDILSDFNGRKLRALSLETFKETLGKLDGDSCFHLLHQGVRAPTWVDAPNCFSCGAKFTLTRRKHHCRNCGQIFCDGCSNKRLPVPTIGLKSKVRVCHTCFDELSNKKTAKAATDGDSSDDDAASLPPEDEDLRLAVALLGQDIARATDGDAPQWDPSMVRQHDPFQRRGGTSKQLDWSVHQPHVHLGASGDAEEKIYVEIGAVVPDEDNIYLQVLPKDPNVAAAVCTHHELNAGDPFEQQCTKEVWSGSECPLPFRKNHTRRLSADELATANDGWTSFFESFAPIASEMDGERLSALLIDLVGQDRWSAEQTQLLSALCDRFIATAGAWSRAGGDNTAQPDLFPDLEIQEDGSATLSYHTHVQDACAVTPAIIDSGVEGQRTLIGFPSEILHQSEYADNLFTTQLTEDGIIKAFDDLFSSAGVAPSKHPLVLTIALRSSLSLEELLERAITIATVAFEHFSVPKVSFPLQAAMGLNACEEVEKGTGVDVWYLDDQKVRITPMVCGQLVVDSTPGSASFSAPVRVTQAAELCARFVTRINKAFGSMVQQWVTLPDALLKSICLRGHNLTQESADRFKAAFAKELPKSLRATVRVYLQKPDVTFAGTSALTRLASFESMSVTRAAYLQHGSSVVRSALSLTPLPVEGENLQLVSMCAIE